MSPSESGVRLWDPMRWAFLEEGGRSYEMTMTRRAFSGSGRVDRLLGPESKLTRTKNPGECILLSIGLSSSLTLALPRDWFGHPTGTVLCKTED
jgi:hypothetical protein